MRNLFNLSPEKWLFNSGMMLLNLALMRKRAMPEKLLNAKKSSKDFALMDQPFFNKCFAGNVKLLPLKYNFLPVWLYQNSGKLSLARSRERALKIFGLNISQADDILSEDVHVAHFAGTEKPWNNAEIPFAKDWLDANQDFSQIWIREFAAGTLKFTPKVSVIIPVYNVEKYLRECLDSVVNQTLKEIEIICVDDGSTDSSPQILEEYAARDPRIKLILSPQNKGTFYCRLKGVQASRGRYVMFLDGDDSFSPFACEKALDAITKNRVDVLQFGTNIVNVAGVSEARIQMNAKMLAPHLKKLSEDNLIEACWGKKLLSANLLNKIFDGEICRKVFWEISCDDYLLRAEDWLAFFAIAYYAKSYFGIPDKLYNYHFGIGIIGGNSVSQKKFEAILSQKRIWQKMRDFLADKDDKSRFDETLKSIKNTFLRQAIDAWSNKTEASNSGDFFRRMTEVWGQEDVICALAEGKWFDTPELGEKLFGSGCFAYEKRPTGNKKTVAFYYRCISNGGAQRVVAELCNIFAEKKDADGDDLFNVVLVTDETYSGIADEYFLSPKVKRATVPPFGSSRKGEYRARFKAWREIVSAYSVDAVVSALWAETITFWDMLAVKGHERRPAFVVHSHNYFDMLYLHGEQAPLRWMTLCSLCDGVVVLSDCDARVAGKKNPHVRTIANPLTFDPQKTRESSREKNTLLWVGRISGEKSPLDAVEMMRYVVEEIPDAKLTMVGSGDEKLFDETRKRIEEWDLSKNVETVGFCKNVEEYYGQASLLVHTASYEGFPLTFAEAFSHALPVLCYAMPWLRFSRDGRGIVPVERKNLKALAKEVVKLLKDPEKAATLGRRGKEQIVEIGNEDIAGEWQDLFAEIDGGVPVNKKELSAQECAELDAINEEFVGVFRNIRKGLPEKISPLETEKNVSHSPAERKVYPAFWVRLGAMFILNKGARKRWRARHMDLTPKDGIDVNAHPEMRRDGALKRLGVRLASLFIFSKKKRKAFRAKHLNLRPRDGVDVKALSSQELSRLREAKRSRSVLWRIFDALVPVTRGKIVHTERHLRRAAEEQTQILLEELRRLREETNRRFSALEREVSAARERDALLERKLAETQAALDRKADARHEALMLKILAVKHAAESANARAVENAETLAALAKSKR